MLLAISIFLGLAVVSSVSWRFLRENLVVIFYNCILKPLFGDTFINKTLLFSFAFGLRRWLITVNIRMYL